MITFIKAGLSRVKACLSCKKESTKTRLAYVAVHDIITTIQTNTVAVPKKIIHTPHKKQIIRTNEYL